MHSLVSLEWATDYFAYFRPNADEWDVKGDTERQRYLNRASVLIRSAFVFQSDVDIDNDNRIRVAVCEQALWLMRRTDQYPDVLTKGIASAAIGGASATFSKDFVAPLICEEAKLAIGDAGYFIKDVAVVTTMPLGGIWAEPTLPPHKQPIRPPTEKTNFVPMTDSEVEDLVHRILNR
jgi:hypothetical protein